MNTYLQRKGFAIVVACVVAVVGITSAHAQWVVTDPGLTMRSIIAETKRGLDAAKDYAQQSRQLQTQINQYNDMVTQGKGLSDTQWGSVVKNIRDLASIYKDSRALAADVKGMEEEFGQAFGGYKQYVQQFGRGKSIRDQLEKWGEQGSDNAMYAMKAAGMQVDMMEGEDAAMAKLMASSRSAEGRMQALQVANEIAAQQVQQTQKMRQLIVNMTQMQANAYAIQADRQAKEDASTQQFIKKPVNRTKGKEY